jgi:hypothetical protein
MRIWNTSLLSKSADETADLNINVIEKAGDGLFPYSPGL